MKTLIDEYGDIVKEREVGEIFQDGNTTLKVEACLSCHDCFYHSQISHCTRTISIAGECSTPRRSDKTEVSFKKIESNKKEIMRDIILIAGIPNPNGGDNYLKLQTVKFVKDTLGLGLKEAKDLVDAIPSKIAENVTIEKAGELTKAFEKEGMKIEVRGSLTGKLVYTTKLPVTPKNKPHYWIMGTPDRGDDIYNALKDKDPLLQSKNEVNIELIEDPLCLSWVNDEHKINIMFTKNNASLIDLIKRNWTKLELPWKPEDKQLVWACLDEKHCVRMLTFYDAKNDCCFYPDGKRNGNNYYYYAPFEGEYPEWAKEALKKLED